MSAMRLCGLARFRRPAVGDSDNNQYSRGYKTLEDLPALRQTNKDKRNN